MVYGLKFKDKGLRGTHEAYRFFAILLQGLKFKVYGLKLNVK